MRRFTVLLSLGLILTSGVCAGEFRVALVLDRGGRDDKSFNSSAYEGATRAEKDLKIFLKQVEAPDDNAFEPILRSFAQRRFDLIIGVGFAQKDAINKVASQFPQTKFAIVDAEVTAPNVKSLMFQEHEGSYLVGAIAGMCSKSGKIGFLGGMDIPLIRRFLLAYEAGAKQINPEMKVQAYFVGVTGEAWNNPPKGKELALALYESGADVVFAAAGASALGAFDAAEERRKWIIGVDSNQNWIKPGLVLTSMLKRVDLAVYRAIEEASKGEFKAGIQRFGLADKGIDYAVDQHNEKLLSDQVRAKAEELKAAIINGSIQVPDYYVKRDGK